MLAGWLGMDLDPVGRAVQAAVRSGAGRGGAGGAGGSAGRGGDARGDGRSPGARGRDGGPGDRGRDGGPGGHDPREAVALPEPRMTLPDPRDPVTATERRALEAVLQLPELVPVEFDDLDGDSFTAPAYRAVHAAVRAAGGAAAARALVASGAPGASLSWVEQVREQAAAPVEGLITRLAVAPLPEDRPDVLPTYVRGLVMALVEMGMTRQIADLKGRLQRMDPTGDPEGYRAVVGELMAQESRKRALRESA
jgi:DNA primase